MIPELGHFALIMALVMALIQASLPAIGAAKGINSWVELAKPVARLQLLFVLFSFAALAYAFVVHDFSVAYVANHSNTALPLVYRISAVWGGHEGSLLLWALTLSIWTGAVTIFSSSIPKDMLARVISVMGMVSVGFLLFMLLTSNPFDRLVTAPLEGRDLNPLLQDFGLIIHPPMLYMGYVGFSVAFAFAIAAMLGGKLDAAWARWSRPWTNIAWLFLTLGISLGSWWAYYELGWGGWWFWDPVENASFMPWLVGTALMHSLAVTEKRGTFKAWTVLLAISAFSLSLLGTFLVRSGVLTSVHAFATDPGRGVFILIFLIVVIGGSLALYAWRAPSIRSSTTFELFSRETALLINNVILVVVAASILLGTLYPLLLDALGVGKISVGPPYFESVFVPLTIPLALLMGIGALMRWKQDKPERLIKALGLLFAISIVIGGLLPLLFSRYEFGAAIGLMLATWITLTTLQGVRLRLVNKDYSLKSFMSITRSFYGMSIAHIGIAVFIVGITLTSIYSEEKDVRMVPGEEFMLNGYNFKFKGISLIQGPNYQAQKGHLTVSKDNQLVATMYPEKRVYRVQRMPMTEAAIDAGITRDLFIALGEPRGAEGAWSLRLYVKPFIRWIWFGTIIMALGGLLAATDRRYRLAGKNKKEATV
ncbi:MAG: heme lyase CcmF/NrfE family subunit [Gammaproteobacteria bacterium]|nr:heme lyase CcmF/NrfE family subunit [Gammaproteobacteria bacterium]MDH5659365.1 heme lyase CcmF/NrfE family subunit [Gammaproteobacteria bacterium]